MLSIVASSPLHMSADQYIDQPLTITFSEAPAASFLTNEFFTLYHTNDTLSEFYETIGTTFRQEGNVVTITPMVQLKKTTWYVLVVIGGDAGIRSLTDDTISENLSIQFCTASSASPAAGVTTTINDVEVSVNDPGTVQVQNPSTDLFAADGAGVPIVLLRSIPAHHAVGIGDFSKVILTYNDEIGNVLSTSAFRMEAHELPIALDPFAVPTIQIKTATIDGMQVLVDVEDVTVAPNIEYIFRIAAHSVRGRTRKAYDGDSHELRFISSLVPLYALPEQIRKRLSSFIDGANIQVSDYDLYKLIHEKSLWVRDVMKLVVTKDNIILANKLTICLVLKELFVTGLVMQGQVKSRELLSTKIEFFQANISDALGQLDTCIKEAMAAANTESGYDIQYGIRAVQYLNRPVKAYDATYR